MKKYLLGFDIGSSSVKAAIVDVDSGKAITTAQSPNDEMIISSTKPGWAEQDPEMWWHHAKESLKLAFTQSNIIASEICAIGISYQMHGLVCVDKNLKPLRPSIIWCDSRASEIGEEAFQSLSKDFCLSHYLNSPGNFTASKLKWVKEYEPHIYDRLYKIMLPGDYIAMKLTGDVCTTASGLSEGILWDYKTKSIAHDLLNQYGIDSGLLPNMVPTFSEQGKVLKSIAQELGLKEGTPVSYRAGDQPNNAFSLNVLNPGETAATAGTSGVVYSVTDKNAFDKQSRVNAFVHVNNGEEIRNGVLLCINGTGILNSWLRKNIQSGSSVSYEDMNAKATEVSIGSDGLQFYPFGNGGERIFENKILGASLHGLDFNRHNQNHIMRAAQEGIVFSLKYGFDILKQMECDTSIVRAGLSNMFLSPVFREAFVNTLKVPLELFETNGAVGAAIGAGIGSRVYNNFSDAFIGLSKAKEEQPNKVLEQPYGEAYEKWLKGL